MKVATRRAFAALACALVSACAFNSHTNRALEPGAPPPGRATLAVTPERGNPKVLVMLALSGGGSRAAYFSGRTMLELQRLFPDRDLLREVDVISSVSGGSIAAAYYAVSKDAYIDDADLAAAAEPAPPAEAVAPGKLRRQENRLYCSQPLAANEEARLRERLKGALRARDPGYATRRVADLCRQSTVVSNYVWDPATVEDLMTRNYVWRWFGNWFWPWNIARYWFTAFDRSDLMARTFASNLYSVGIIERDLTFAELNPERPYLIINSTNATGGYEPGPGDGFAFGSVFTFTSEDFRERVASDLSSYSVARAVMASASFPVVFASMTLRDFRPQSAKEERYVHVFDGGNSDNLGLATLKRVMLQAALDKKIADEDPIVVISIDAFTRPAGTPSAAPDSRGDWFSFFLDTNLVSAIDSLLQANRDSNLEQFRKKIFTWKECSGERPVYPRRLCEAADRLGPSLAKRLVFYHIGFDDVGNELTDDVDKDGNTVKIRLADRLDRIPTSLNIKEPDRVEIEKAVKRIVRQDNECLAAIRGIVAGAGPSPEAAHDICQRAEPEMRGK